MALYSNVEVTLIENSGGPTKIIAGQTVRIEQVPDVVEKGVDSFISLGKMQSPVIWYGGKASDLESVTHVKIVTTDRVFKCKVTRHNEEPRDVPKGVMFWVLL
jgi:hypothetical protein